MATINEKMTTVANAIRTKTGKTAKLNLDTMASDLNEIEERTSSNLTASGATVTVPAGNYKANATKSVATATQATPSITVSSSGLITASSTQTAGYVSAGTKSATKQLTTQDAKTVTPSTSSQTAVNSGVYTTGAITVAAIPSSYVKPSAIAAAATITPTTSNQTIAAGTYCSGAQTIAGDADLKATNIKKGVNIFGVAGSYEGAELNFKVVGGASASASPAENTIWVNTNTAITSWDFSAKYPARRSGNKNLIVYPYYGVGTSNGITYTDNGDGTVKANGTATANGQIWIEFYVEGGDKNLVLPAGTYILSGAPSVSGCYVVAYKSDGTYIGGAHAGGTFTFTLTEETKMRILLRVTSGTTVSNVVFKPQLEKGSSATAFVKGDATGQVWIQTGTASPVEFNSLKSNAIQIYPSAAMQYVNGAWVSKVAKIYQNSAWQDWDMCLLDGANKYEAVTGGWTSDTSMRIWENQGNSEGTVTQNDSGLVFPGVRTVARTVNKINMNSYSKLYFYVPKRYETVQFALMAHATGSMENGQSAWLSISYEGTYSIDVSALTDSYYVVIGSDGVGTATIEKVWLEV